MGGTNAQLLAVCQVLSAVGVSIHGVKRTDEAGCRSRMSLL